MALSYLLRLLCVFAVSLGVLHIAFEVLIAACAPLLFSVLQWLTIRQRERALYLLQVAPFLLAAACSAFFFWQYFIHETNLSAERVGWPSLVLASGLLLWWSFAFAAGLRMILRTRRFSRICRSSATHGNIRSTPVFAVADSVPRVALVGLLRPFIFISRSLVESGGLNPQELDVVLDHERSHARHCDNWKLLSLACLPRLGLRLAKGKSWMQRWQQTAEWAADEDAVRGDSARAFILAETLVKLARSSAAPIMKLACTHFACDDSELALRVERLIGRPASTPGPFGFTRKASLCLLGLGLAVLLVNGASLLRDLPEQLLHLG